MVVLNVAGIMLATLRSVGVLAVLLLWSTRPSGFFAYQLMVALLELVVRLALVAVQLISSRQSLVLITLILRSHRHPLF